MTERSQPGVPTVSLSSGSAMPLVGFGTWSLRGAAAVRAVRAALDAGYQLLDTATMYRNEAEVGRAIHDSGISRDQLFVTTKLQPGDAGKEREIIQASLSALGLDHVDLWLVHWPPSDQVLVRTWERFLAIRDEGLAKAVGVSNYSIGQIDRLTDATGVAPAVNQVPWAPTLFDAGFLGASRDRGVVVEGYSPFKNTNLDDPTLTAIARRHSVTTAQVIIRWHVQHEVVAIPKSASPERMAQNLDVAGFDLSEADMLAIDGLGP